MGDFGGLGEFLANARDRLAHVQIRAIENAKRFLQNAPCVGGEAMPLETDGVRPDMQEGEPCPKCSTPVIKRKGRWKPSRDYYYEFHLWCPKCEIAYHVESAKRIVEQPPSLF